jgi:hypothetical protein
MVEINLFEDEEPSGKREKASEPASKKEERQSGDSLKDDDFNFDDDLSEPGLGEFVPDNELTEEPSSSRQKASKAASTKKKTSPLFLVIVAVVTLVLLVVMYKLPGVKSTRKPVKSRRAVPTAVKTTPDSAGLASSRILQKADLSSAPKPGQPGAAAGRTAALIDATKAVVEALVRDKQFVAMLLKDDAFFVEYASETRGASDAVGQKLQSILRADGFRASPEDRLKFNDSARFCGVISGALPKRPPETTPATAKGWIPDQFKAQLNTWIAQAGLSGAKIQLFPEYPATGQLVTPVRVSVAGAKANAFKLLDSVRGLRGNAELVKLLFVRQENTGLEAEQVKMVFDFMVKTG